MQIRPVQLSDAPRLAELMVAAWRWGYKGLISDEELARVHITFTQDSFEERIKANKSLYLVAVDDLDHPIGLSVEYIPASLPNYDREIGGLYVTPNSTRSGVGRALVKAMATEFIAQGSTSLCIHTLKANPIGRGFYEKMGGQLVGEDMWREFPAVWYGWEDVSRLLGL